MSKAENKKQKNKKLFASIGRGGCPSREDTEATELEATAETGRWLPNYKLGLSMTPAVLK